MTTVERFVSYNLGSLPWVKAIFFMKKEYSYSIYTVIDEFSESLFAPILTEEELIIDTFPEYQFDFRVREAQGRDPSEAVPVFELL